MITKEKNSLDTLRDRQPFRVPYNYFEDFTADFMRRLPEKTVHETKIISFYDRIKPWLYMAAMFVGIIVLFNIYHNNSEIQKEKSNDVLSSANVKADVEDNDDAAFLDYMEELYVDKYALAYIYDDYLIDY